MEGSTVGIVANQPMVLAGCLDIDSQPQGRPVRPVLRCVQHPVIDACGRAGLPARHGIRNTAASSSTARNCCMHTPNATVPKVTVITRKAYGGAYDVMASKHLRGDVNYAWPTLKLP